MGCTPEPPPQGVLGPKGSLPSGPQASKGAKQKLAGQLQQLAGWQLLCRTAASPLGTDKKEEEEGEE